MKVSVSQFQNSVMRQKPARISSSPSFGGVKINPETIEAAKKAMGKFPKALFLTEKFQGELCNAWITAVGTALIAPFFIAFNPFSKEDKETKCYSAWRQPISAVLQLVTQLGINYSFNKYMDKMASTGCFEMADMRSCPADSYVETLVKHKHPNATKQELEMLIKDEKTRAFRESVAKARQELKGKPILDDQLVSRSDLEKEIEAIKDPIKKEIKDLKKAKGSEQRIIELTKQLKDEDTIAQKAMQNVKRNVLEQMEANAKKKLRIRELNKGNRTVEQAIEIAKQKLQAAAADPKDAKIWEKVIEKLKDIGNYETGIHAKKPFETLKDLGKNYDEILNNERIKQFVKAKGDVAKFTLKQMRLWSSIVISLLMLPVSCYLLNYTYPRLMEKIMPNAGKKKHADPPKKEMEVK